MRSGFTVFFREGGLWCQAIGDDDLTVEVTYGVDDDSRSSKVLYGHHGETVVRSAMLYGREEAAQALVVRVMLTLCRESAIARQFIETREAASPVCLSARAPTSKAEAESMASDELDRFAVWCDGKRRRGASAGVGLSDSEKASHHAAVEELRRRKASAERDAELHAVEGAQGQGRGSLAWLQFMVGRAAQDVADAVDIMAAARNRLRDASRELMRYGTKPTKSVTRE